MIERPTHEEIVAAIAEARAAGTISRTEPYLHLGGNFGVQVCSVCLAEPGYEGGLCAGCDDKRRWRELCPPRYQKHATIDQLGQGPNPWSDEEVAWVMSFLDSDARTLGLISAPGRGKTTAAFAVVRAMLDRDWYSVVYATATEMLIDLNARQFEADAHERYTKPDILLLDEVGDRDGGLTDFQKQQLHLVLEKRYREEKLLIWTSNIPLKELRKWCADRTWERLWDEACVLQVGGQSRRRLAA